MRFLLLICLSSKADQVNQVEEVAEETINGREETIFCLGERVATPSHGEQPVVTAPAEG